MHVFGVVLGWHFLGTVAQLSEKGAPKGAPKSHFGRHFLSTVFDFSRNGDPGGPRVDFGPILKLFSTYFSSFLEHVLVCCVSVFACVYVSHVFAFLDID